MVPKKGLQAAPEEDEGLRYSERNCREGTKRSSQHIGVKVHRHTGKPVNAVADAMATEGADRKMEDDERPLYEIPETTNLIFVFKEVDNGRESKGQWSPTVKARIHEHEAERLWD